MRNVIIHINHEYILLNERLIRKSLLQKCINVSIGYPALYKPCHQSQSGRGRDRYVPTFLSLTIMETWRLVFVESNNWIFENGHYHIKYWYCDYHIKYWFTLEKGHAI